MKVIFLQKRNISGATLLYLKLVIAYLCLYYSIYLYFNTFPIRKKPYRLIAVPKSDKKLKLDKKCKKTDLIISQQQ